MNYKIYKIQGINNETKRIKTFKIPATSKENAINEAITKGLIEPKIIEIIPHFLSDKSLIENCLREEIDLPDGCTSEDAYAIYLRHKEYDGLSPNPDLIEFATDRNICFSKYIGKRALYNLISETLNIYSKVAFFVFCVYRWLSEDRRGNLDKNEKNLIFYEIAKELLENKKFLSSLLKYYQGEDLRTFGNFTNKKGKTYKATGSSDTLAYKKAIKYLIRYFPDLPEYKDKSLFTNEILNGKETQSLNCVNQDKLIQPTFIKERQIKLKEVCLIIIATIIFVIFLLSLIISK